jgi:hypothetical protein
MSPQPNRRPRGQAPRTEAHLKSRSRKRARCWACVRVCARRCIREGTARSSACRAATRYLCGTVVFQHHAIGNPDECEPSTDTSSDRVEVCDRGWNDRRNGGALRRWPLAGHISRVPRIRPWSAGSRRETVATPLLHFRTRGCQRAYSERRQDGSPNSLD